MISALDESQLPDDAGVRADLLAATGHVEQTLSRWAAGLRDLGLAEVSYLQDKTPVAVIRECLAHCRDTVIPPKTPGLEFISDLDYRGLLREDLASVKADLDNREWKSATILGGSLIEALLLDALELVKSQALSAAKAQKSKGRVLPLDRWDLCALVLTAQKIGIIDPETKKLADHARDFRNYVHPGKARRMSRRCSLSTAHVVYAALDAVIEDLKKWHAASGRP
jgi:hypothetical protein